jgi:hypothetical protein
MAWFRNHYHCGDCGTDWEDEWSCCCDDECPNCGSGDWSPVECDDLTFLIEPEQGTFAVYVSPISAGHYPDYELAARTLDHGGAKAYVNYRLASYWS